MRYLLAIILALSAAAGDDVKVYVQAPFGPSTPRLYHRASCGALAEFDKRELTKTEAEKEYFKPHDTCMNAPPPAPEPSDRPGCVKMVFGKYCLGGPRAGGIPPSAKRSPNGAWAWTANGQMEAAGERDGRIASVVRVYEPGTWLTFHNVVGPLVEKYGPGRDVSFFPGYATDDDTKEVTIALKKGQAGRLWDEGEYTIELLWQDAKSMVLAYRHKALMSKAAKAEANDF
jgi:hypothetical protein